MKKSITLLLAMIAMSANAQFLFRVSGNQLKEPSYIMGSIHTIRDTVIEKMPAYLEAEAKCKQFYNEIDVTDTIAAKSTLTLSPKIETLPDGKNIMDLMNKDQIELLDMRFKETVYKNFTDSTMKDFWDKKPATIATALIGIIALQEQLKNDRLDEWGTKFTARIDYTCLKRAKDRGLKVGQLEEMKTHKSYLDTIMSAINDTTMTIDSLMTFLMNLDECRQLIANDLQKTGQLIKYWYNGDYDSLTKDDIFVKHVNSMTVLIKERNLKWLPIMQTAMNEAPTMFIFGALHLIGDNGIIKELRNKGYTVEQIPSRVD